MPIELSCFCRRERIQTSRTSKPAALDARFGRAGHHVSGGIGRRNQLGRLLVDELHHAAASRARARFGTVFFLHGLANFDRWREFDDAGQPLPVARIERAAMLLRGQAIVADAGNPEEASADRSGDRHLRPIVHLSNSAAVAITCNEVAGGRFHEKPPTSCLQSMPTKQGILLAATWTRKQCTFSRSYAWCQVIHRPERIGKTATA